MPQQPAKHNPARFIFVATGLVVALVLAGVLTNWKWHWLTGEPTYETPGLSPDYLPPDTGAVLRIDLRQTQDSNFLNKELGPMLPFLLARLAPGDMQKGLG